MKYTLTGERGSSNSGKNITLDLHITDKMLDKIHDDYKKTLELKVFGRIDGQFFSKMVKLGFSRANRGSSTVITMPLPYGQNLKKTLAYKVMVDADSYTMLLTDRCLSGHTFKGAITTNIYVNKTPSKL